MCVCTSITANGRPEIYLGEKQTLSSPFRDAHARGLIFPGADSPY